MAAGANAERIIRIWRGAWGVGVRDVRLALGSLSLWRHETVSRVKMRSIQPYANVHDNGEIKENKGGKSTDLEKKGAAMRFG